MYNFQLFPGRTKVLLSDIVSTSPILFKKRNMFAQYLLKLPFYSSCQNCHWIFNHCSSKRSGGYFYRSLLHAPINLAGTSQREKFQNDRSGNTQGTRFVAQCTRAYDKSEVAVNQKNASCGFNTRGKFSIGRLREHVVSRFA